MGYHMYLMETSFTIKKENQDKALEAIQGLSGQETIKGYSGPDHFSWVDTEEFMKAHHIEDAFRAWRWSTTFNDNGDITNINFEGEKYGDDLILFSAIAPYIEDGYIQMKGEDDAVWRWVFKNGSVKEVPGNITITFLE